MDLSGYVAIEKRHPRPQSSSKLRYLCNSGRPCLIQWFCPRLDTMTPSRAVDNFHLYYGQLYIEGKEQYSNRSKMNETGANYLNTRYCSEKKKKKKTDRTSGRGKRHYLFQGKESKVGYL